MKQRLPQKGDIWRDWRGPFLVLEEHDLSRWDAANDYVCQITVVDMVSGMQTNGWTVSRGMWEELVFIA